MKHRLLPVLLLLTGSLYAQYSENFESYNVGDGIAEAGGSAWIIWESAQSTGMDAFVSAEAALSGEKSLKLESDDYAGGPQDVVLVFGEAGAFEVTFNVLVPEGNSGYYNIQENAAPGLNWAFECVLSSTGLATYQVDDSLAIQTPFTTGQWVKITHRLDTETDLLQLFIDDAFVGQFPYDGLQLGGINFYAAGDQATPPTYYIDDITADQLEGLQVAGCTDITACTYDETAEIDNAASCLFPGDGCDDEDNATINDVYGEDCTCAGEVDGIGIVHVNATIAPNPAQDFVRVQANLNQATIRVLSLDGKIVVEERRNDLSVGAELQLNLNDGLYLLEVTEGSNRTTQRLVIQN